MAVLLNNLQEFGLVKPSWNDEAKICIFVVDSNQSFLEHAMNRPAILTLLCIVSSTILAQVPVTHPDAATGFSSIRAEDLKRHVYVLASDSLEGRETSYPGQRKAAQYIASEFKRLNLKPVGTDGGYLQPFNVTITKIDPSSTITISRSGVNTEYRWGKDFMAETGRDSVFSGPIAFIGHTDCVIPDAERARLAGRIVFMLAGKREHVGETTRPQTLRRLYAQRREPGVAALMVIADDAGPGSIDSVIQLALSFGVDRGRMTMEEPTVQRSGMTPRFIVSPMIAQQILQSAGHSLTALRQRALGDSLFSPVFVDEVNISAAARVIRERRTTENVLGLVEGSDPVLKNEAIVISGHYDHVGMNAAGSVFYGADDDASGTSAVIELAEAFASNPVRPKRSILFLTVTAEEKGMFGSSFYVANPAVPLERTVSNLNMDMIGRVDSAHAATGPQYVYVIGSDKISTELDSILNVANRETERLAFDYTYNDERDPNNFYRRSDHYNFAKNGIPVVFFFTGLHEDYHRPTDTADKLLYDRMASITRVVFTTAWKLAQMPRMLLKNVH